MVDSIISHTKMERHDILVAEILLKLALNTSQSINQPKWN